MEVSEKIQRIDALVSHDKRSAVADPHLLLINVYDNPDQFQHEVETDEEEKIKKVFVPNEELVALLPERRPGTSLIRSREKFLEAFKSYTCGTTLIPL